MPLLLARMRFRFPSIGAKLAVLYATLFAIALAAMGGVVQTMIRSHAENSVKAELIASGSVFDDLWALRAKTLGDTADVVTRDFGFRSAVASGDVPTIRSALATLGARAGGSQAVLVGTDGSVIGASGSLGKALAALPFDLAPGRRDAVIDDGSATYRVVVSPVLAPTPIGWVVFVLPLDEHEMRALEKLSAIPLTATILRRDSAGHWVSTRSHVGGSWALDALVTRSRTQRELATLDFADGAAFSLVKPLHGPTARKMPAALLVRYSLAAALAPYLPLRIGLLAVGLVGLLFVVLASVRLARGIARPIAALDAASRALEEGARTEVAVVGEDEIGRLAESFNRMSAGIVERENRISHLAFHDTLTGLPNRTLFRQSLEEALARAMRLGGSIVVMCLDLDGFKVVNDTLGHPVGDSLLRDLGLILTELVPDGMIARLGGDEFAIVLQSNPSPERVRAIAQSIIDRTARPMETAGHQVSAGFSIGIALGPQDGADPDHLLKNADLALYRAKKDGRGTFRFFETGLDIAARQRRQLELDLREALHAGQFRLNFQPVYDLKADRIGGFEALLRWHHPVRGEVSPAEFIPVAEETGLIVAIGNWVINEACRRAKHWPDHVRVAVNVSPLQFRNPSLQSAIMNALAHSGLSPTRLEIEITESVFLDGQDHVLKLLHGLKELGVRVALDDFGTGYSSLSYLRSFPFDKIKIDRAFVTSVAEDSSAAAIVRAIVDLAEALKMDTTAEGVENDDQLDRLRLQGCGNIQGYLFSRPLEAQDVDDLIRSPVRRVA